ncbi:MAG: hypothetical protein ACLRJC_04575 [Emergencia timonensis]|uniref:hypothetical protein n=1 Tax=Emergencia timonensis TaxID=1776384 RepID=UPI00082A5639|nr:hypothetical protein [Emergencia timonensis]WNX87222.1 hypothetical protein RVY71_13445 [Emergencia timonensis]
MNSNFAKLGLREDATKEQVKQAYELRLRKYKSSDYDDDPDYVRKKIAELKTAYNAAYSVAGNNRTADHSDDYERKEFKPRRYEPEKYDHDKFERDRDRAARQGEERRFKTPDVSKLRDKMDTLKSTVSENVGGFVEDIRKASEQRDGEPEERRETSARATANVRRLNDNQSGRIIEPTPQPVHTPRLDDSGSGGIIQTPTGADKPVYDGSSSSAKGGSVAGMIIALLIGVVIMFASMCDDGGDDYNYDDYDDSSYSFTYNNDGDENIYNTAIDVNNLLYAQSSADSYSSDGYTEEEIKKAADRFAKNYLKMDDITSVTSYLYDNYEEYATDTSESYEEQITQVLAFYGFMDVYEAEGTLSPYTHKPITDLLAYIKYINKYYRENGLANEGEEL